MNEEVKQRWVSALRSGDYAQTNGALADRNGFCCLGVLCEIAVEDGIVYRSPADGVMAYSSVNDSVDREQGVLPRAVAQWAGLNETNPIVNNIYDPKDGPGKVSVAYLNDSHVSFSLIADEIEKSL